MEQLMKDGHVSRGYLGIGIATVNRAVAKQFDLKASSGVLVANVERSGPASKAGLVEGDVITAINGTTVKTGDVLRNMIAAFRPGTQVSLDVTHRNGKTDSVKAKLAELPDEPSTLDPRTQVPSQKQRRQPSVRRFRIQP